MSTERSMMSSARLSSLDQIDLMLYTVNAGRLRASRSLLSLTILLLKHRRRPSDILDDGLEEIITGIKEESTKMSLGSEHSWIDTFPSSWIISLCKRVCSSKSLTFTKCSSQKLHSKKCSKLACSGLEQTLP